MSHEDELPGKLKNDREWSQLFSLVEEAVIGCRGHHPGIITEAVVDAVAEEYEILPREIHHRERRKNHRERIRRLTHEIFRIINAEEGEASVEKITAGIMKSFLITPRVQRGGEE